MSHADHLASACNGCSCIHRFVTPPFLCLRPHLRLQTAAAEAASGEAAAISSAIGRLRVEGLYGTPDRTRPNQERCAGSPLLVCSASATRIQHSFKPRQWRLHHGWVGLCPRAAGQLVAGVVQLGQGQEEGKLLLTRALKVAHNAMTNHQLVSQVGSSPLLFPFPQRLPPSVPSCPPLFRRRCWPLLDSGECALRFTS